MAASLGSKRSREQTSTSLATMSSGWTLSTSSSPWQAQPQQNVGITGTCGRDSSGHAPSASFESRESERATSRQESSRSGAQQSSTCEATRRRREWKCSLAWQVRMRIIEANLASITKQEFLPPRTPSHRKNCGNGARHQEEVGQT